MFSGLSQRRQQILQFAGTLLAVVLLFVLLREGGWEEILSAMQKMG